jgi:hypothetical protein
VSWESELTPDTNTKGLKVPMGTDTAQGFHTYTVSDTRIALTPAQLATGLPAMAD